MADTSATPELPTGRGPRDPPGTDTGAPAPGESAAAVRAMFGRDSLFLVLWTAQIVLTALFTPITTRLVGQDAYGLIGTSLALMSVLTVLVGFGLSTGVQRAYAGPDGEAAARRVITMALGVAVLGSAILYATGPVWSDAIGLPGFPAVIRYAVIYAAASALTYCTLSVLRSRNQLAAFAAVTLTQSILAECLAVGLVLGVARTSSAYVLGEMLAQVVAALIGLVAVAPGRVRRVDLAPLWATLRFSAAIVPGMAAAFVLAASDRLVVQGDLGPRAAAHYNISSNIGGFALTILGMLDVIWLPRLLSIEDRPLRRRVIGEASTALSVMVIAVAGTIALASPLILRIWAPASYDPDRLQWVVSLIAASAIPFSLARLPVQSLLAVGRAVAVTLMSCAAAGLNFALNVLLVPRFGIRASAAATLIAFAAEMIGVWYVARAEVPPPGLRQALVVVLGTGAVVVSAALPPTGVYVAIRAALTLLAVLGFAGILLRTLAPGSLSRRIGRVARR